MLIKVSIPSMLRDCCFGKIQFELDATSLGEAVELLLNNYPKLRVHLYKETGELREHVLLFYNDENIAWLESLDLPLQKGDKLTVMQAVSGG
jgi:sulfur-carrier protein